MHVAPDPRIVGESADKVDRLTTAPNFTEDTFPKVGGPGAALSAAALSAAALSAADLSAAAFPLMIHDGKFLLEGRPPLRVPGASPGCG